jgi:hypothetical protein
VRDFEKRAKFLRKYDILGKAPSFEKASDFGKSRKFLEKRKIFGKVHNFKKTCIFVA